MNAIKKEVFLYNAFPESVAQERAIKILKDLHGITKLDSQRYRYTTTPRMTSMVCIVYWYSVPELVLKKN